MSLLVSKLQGHP